MSGPRSGRHWRVGAAALLALAAANAGIGETAISGLAVSVPRPRHVAAIAPPTLPIRNAATDLAETLDGEARELLVESQRMQAEAAVGLAARGRLRSVAAFLLQSGATRPWDDSTTVVAGIRLSGILRRCDGLIADALDARSARDGRPLGADDARAAVEAVEGIARLDLDAIRDVCRTTGPLTEVRLTAALAETLAPLVRLSEVVEGMPLPDPWPADRPNPAGARAPTSVETDAELARLVATIALDERRTRAAKALEAARAMPGEERARVHEAVGLVVWLASLEPALARQCGQALDRLLLALDDVTASAPDAGAGARGRLAGLTTLVGAARALLDAASGPDADADARSRFSRAAEALLAGELGVDVARRVPNATRILAVLGDRPTDVTAHAEGAARASDRGDLHDALRRLDREAKAAHAALPAATLALATEVEGEEGVDGDAESAIERVLSIDADRRRIARLGEVIDAMRRIDPKATRDVVTVARRLARELGDPRRRPEAEAAIEAIDRVALASFPLPYEDELRRRGDAALERTGGQAARLVEVAAEARRAWIAEVAAGEADGAAAVRLDRIGRLFACLRDLDGVDAPITREAGDRLATWGAWTSRRAALAPAAADPIARATLASRSMLDLRHVEAERSFERDVAALERSIPIVALAARLERTLGPLLAAPPDSTSALLAPLVRRPSADATLLELWPRFRMIDRALFEMEFARRNGDQALLDALSGFVAGIAREALDSI